MHERLAGTGEPVGMLVVLTQGSGARCHYYLGTPYNYLIRKGAFQGFSTSRLLSPPERVPAMSPILSSPTVASAPHKSGLTAAAVSYCLICIHDLIINRINQFR